MHKPARNDPCPCGSGLKYKKCCELKKGAPRKFTAQVITGDTVTGKVHGLSRLFQRPAPSAPPEMPSVSATPPTNEETNGKS